MREGDCYSVRLKVDLNLGLPCPKPLHRTGYLKMYVNESFLKCSFEQLKYDTLHNPKSKDEVGVYTIYVKKNPLKMASKTVISMPCPSQVT